jgi:hypothetical protein
MNTLTSDTALTNEQLLEFAPAIFQETKGEERSKRYVHVPTSLVHQEMTKAGFFPVKVIKQRARIEDHTPEARERALVKESFMKHMIMYRHPDALHPEGSPYFGQVGYVGDHAGRCSIQMFAGLLEVRCGNGLFAGRVAEAIRLGHVKLNVMDVIKAAFKMMDSIGVVANWRNELLAAHITHGQAIEFASEALALRWKRGEEPVFCHQLLEKRRAEDDITTLWGVYQVVEENLRLGKQRPWAAIERLQKERERSPDVFKKSPAAVRPVNALDATLTLETSLSNLADDWYKSMKRAA